MFLRECFAGHYRFRCMAMAPCFHPPGPVFQNGMTEDGAFGGEAFEGWNGKGEHHATMWGWDAGTRDTRAPALAL